ncbi:MAG: PSP1 C-terminal domain-containing protein [Planctomycetaceae bacterium]
MIKQAQRKTTLVRYGRIPEVARFDLPDDSGIVRGDMVVVETHRGLMLGEFLEEVPDADPDSDRSTIVRKASAADTRAEETNRKAVEEDFGAWCDRIEKWNLDLQLVDLEWTLDGEKLIFYVLNERGPDCTKLALQAAAGGFGIIEVQPIDGDGLVELPPTGGGCGSGGG